MAHVLYISIIIIHHALYFWYVYLYRTPYYEIIESRESPRTDLIQQKIKGIQTEQLQVSLFTCRVTCSGKPVSESDKINDQLRNYIFEELSIRAKLSHYSLAVCVCTIVILLFCTCTCVQLCACFVTDKDPKIATRKLSNITLVPCVCVCVCMRMCVCLCVCVRMFMCMQWQLDLAHVKLIEY